MNHLNIAGYRNSIITQGQPENQSSCVSRLPVKKSLEFINGLTHKLFPTMISPISSESARKGRWNQRLELAFPYILLFVATLFLYGGLLTGFQLKTHETPDLYFRTFEYYREISQNGFPPALFPDVIQKGGFAFPLYYPPISYLLTTGFYALIHSVTWSVHITLFLSVLLSAWFMYWAGTLVWRKTVAFPTALLFSVFPYRFVDVMVRAALAECWSFVWFPLIFGGMILLVKKKPLSGIPILAVGVAGLLMSHTITALYFIIVFIPLAAALVLQHRAWKSLFSVGIAAILTIGLGAYYFIPQRAGWEWVSATLPDFMAATIEQAREHNVFFTQFFFSRADAWLTISAPGVAQDGLSYEMGMPAFFVVLALCLNFAPGLKQFAHRREGYLLWAALFVSILLIVFLIRPEPFLKVLPVPFVFIQFIWRILGMTAFFWAIVFGCALNRIEFPKAHQIYICAGASIAIMMAVNPLHRAVFYATDVKDLNNLETYINEGDKGFVGLAEYTPRDFDRNLTSFLKEGKVMLQNYGIIKSGNVQEPPRTLELDIKKGGTIVFPLINFPVWKIVTSDGKELQPESHHGLLATQIPEGQYSLQIIRTLAPYQLISTWISAISLAICILIYPVGKYAGRVIRRRKNRAAAAGI